MQNIYHYGLTVLIFSSSMVHVMEDRNSPLTDPLDVNEPPKRTDPSHSPNLKKVRFADDTKDYTLRPLGSLSDDEKKAYKEKEEGIEYTEKKIRELRISGMSKEDFRRELLNFAKNTIPEIEKMIDSSANDIFQVWKCFSMVPTNKEMAQEAYSKINLAFKDYKISNLAAQSRLTGEVLPSIIDEYKDRLATLKRNAIYILNNDPNVEKLNTLILNFNDLMLNKAKELYIAFKKNELDQIFSAVPKDIPFKDQYAEALSLAYSYIDTEKDTETAFYAAMKVYNIKKFSPSDYVGFLNVKHHIDKEMLIERIYPYAKNINESKDSLYLIL